ncbi:class I SAM-dependent methyltransferase [Devosia sp.]|uniref:class I SAM-dependent methyltransferase n=1 Tax=Devosia sp. TaxID=1871048 RepID=UPI003A927CCB
MGHDAAENTKQYGQVDKLQARARLHQLYSRQETPWFPFVFSQGGVNAGDSVLDIGCGPGWFWAASNDSAPDGLSVTLCDLSEGMEREATERVEGLARDWRVAASVADVTALPFQDESFDAIFCLHMLYHVTDQTRAVDELHRVLRPGGRLVVTTNGREDMLALYGLAGRAFDIDPTNPAAALFGFEDAERLLKDRFGNVARHDHQSGLSITDKSHVFDALTSYPPGDTAPPEQLEALRTAISEAFAAGGGRLEADNQRAAFVSVKKRPD